MEFSQIVQASERAMDATYKTSCMLENVEKTSPQIRTM